MCDFCLDLILIPLLIAIKQHNPVHWHNARASMATDPWGLFSALIWQSYEAGSTRRPIWLGVFSRFRLRTRVGRHMPLQLHAWWMVYKKCETVSDSNSPWWKLYLAAAAINFLICCLHCIASIGLCRQISKKGRWSRLVGLVQCKPPQFRWYIFSYFRRLWFSSLFLLLYSVLLPLSLIGFSVRHRLQRKMRGG